MKLFKATAAPKSRRVRQGYIMVMSDEGTYYGWSDHRGLKLPRGVWIKFQGQDRIVEAYSGPSYRNGFHAITEMVQDRSMYLPIFDTVRAGYGAAEWCKIKHRKQLPVKEVSVDLRSLTYTGEMVFTGEEGPDYRGCVATEMRI